MAGEPWQVRMSAKSLKKREKVRCVRRALGPLCGERCLEIGCEKGVLSYHLRKGGGRWVHADTDFGCARSTLALVGEGVVQFDAGRLPFKSEAFDTILAVDILEHVEDDGGLLEEMRRVLKAEGCLTVTVPHTGKVFLMNRLARRLGLSKEVYGHVRDGYFLAELREKLNRSGFRLRGSRSFVGPVTECIEILLNFAYHSILTRKKAKGDVKGTIHPSSESDFQKHRKAFRLYSLLFPFTWLLSRIDCLLPLKGYILLAEARKG